MPVSIKPTPTITGDAAKKIRKMMENPKDNTELLKRCDELAKVFVSK